MVLKIVFFILLAGLTLAYPSPEENFVKPSSYKVKRGINEVRRNLGIYDGKKTTVNKFPYTVAIFFYWSNDELLNCGGAILTESWVYTDANCVSEFKKHSPKDLTIVAGADYIVEGTERTNGTIYDVEQIVLHPSFVDRTYYYSFGLVKIKGTFKWSDKVGNISIADANLKENTEVTFVGYGSGGSSYGPIRQGNMTWLSQSRCKKIFDGTMSWYNTNVCMYDKGKTTMCEGDTGDPVVYNGLLYGHVVGTANAGFCTNNAYPTIVGHTRLVLKWIEKYTGPVSVVV